MVKGVAGAGAEQRRLSLYKKGEACRTQQERAGRGPLTSLPHIPAITMLSATIGDVKALAWA